MRIRSLRKSSERQRPPSSAEAPHVPTPEEQASLERSIRESPEGRAALAAYFRETPEGRAFMERHFQATPEGRAYMEEHLGTPEGRARLEEHLGTPEGRARLEEHLKTPEGRARLEQSFRAKPGGEAELRELIADEIRRQQPTFLEALRGDTAVYASLMLRPPKFETGLALFREAVRLSWANDAFFCLLLYRIRVRLYVRRVPILPTVLHRLCVILAQLDIGTNVRIEPGVYIPHGKSVIDGITHIGRGTVIAPWTSLGLTTGVDGPTVGRNVLVGTGARVLGPIAIGEGARIAANAVVLTDVAPDTTVAGAPAKVVRDRRNDPDAAPPSGVT